jgi:hypothetical protein
LRAPLPDGDIAEATPPGTNVGSSIHAYGGGTYAIDDTRIWYVDSSDDQIHTIARTPNHVTPCAGFEDITAYGDLTPQGGQLIAVGETADGDRLVQFATPGSGPRTLARTDGFFAPHARTVIDWRGCRGNLIGCPGMRRSSEWPIFVGAS